MKQFLEYIIPNIVNHPEDVVIKETEDNGVVVLTIKVHPEDTGRVIGKSGKIINSIRQIVRVLAIKQGTRVNVEIEDGQSDRPAQAAAPQEESVEAPQEPTETSQE